MARVEILESRTLLSNTGLALPALSSGVYTLLPAGAAYAVSGSDVLGSGASGAYLYNIATTQYTTINYPDSPLTIPAAFSGNIVTGHYAVSQNNDAHGFIYDTVSHSFWTMDPPGSTSTDTTPLGTDGTFVVGFYQEKSSGSEHGFVYDTSSHTFSILDVPDALQGNAVPGSIRTRAFDISDGVIVGSYSFTVNTSSSGTEYGFYYNVSSNTFTPLTYPGATTTVLTSISGSNAVGYFIDAINEEHTFLYNITSHVFTEIGYDGGNRIFPSISGNYVATDVVDTNEDVHGLLYDIVSGSSTELDVPNGSDTFLTGIASDTVVGMFDTKTGNYGFIYKIPEGQPVLQMDRAITTDGQSATVDYTVSQADITQPLDFSLYRSDQPYVDNNSVTIGNQIVDPATDAVDLKQGNHHLTLLSGTPLAPTPKLPYVVVVANANNSVDEDPASINVAYFQPPQPMVTIQNVLTTDSKHLIVQYTVDGNDDNLPFTINVYRSSNSQYSVNASANGQVLIASAKIGDILDSTGVKAGINGVHQIEIESFGNSFTNDFEFNQRNALRPDPTHPYVIATGVDPNDLNDPVTGHFQDHFRIYLLGAVAHGYVGSFFPSVTGGYVEPATYKTVDTFADDLISMDGYAPTTFGFHWEFAADSKEPDETVYEGAILANRISEQAAKLTSNRNDVVDVNLIGWSRGGVVVTQAMTDLNANPGLYFPQLEHGFMMETLEAVSKPF